MGFGLNLVAKAVKSHQNASSGQLNVRWPPHDCGFGTKSRNMTITLQILGKQFHVNAKVLPS